MGPRPRYVKWSESGALGITFVERSGAAEYFLPKNQRICTRVVLANTHSRRTIEGTNVGSHIAPATLDELLLMHTEQQDQRRYRPP